MDNHKLYLLLLIILLLHLQQMEKHWDTKRALKEETKQALAKLEEPDPKRYKSERDAALDDLEIVRTVKKRQNADT